MDDLLNAFPKALRVEAKKPVQLLMTQIRPLKYIPEEKAAYFFDVRLGEEALCVPFRLYDDDLSSEFRKEQRIRRYAEMAATDGLTLTQSLILSCLLTRHCDGFVREDALCRIVSTQEAFVVPFVAQLASEYVYEILLQIWLRLDQLSPAVYGPLFRENPAWFSTLRQRMISYWDCYYRWNDYTGMDGGTHRSWRDLYIGFTIFDAFKNMAERCE